jgi:hypothetical protein
MQRRFLFSRRGRVTYSVVITSQPRMTRMRMRACGLKPALFQPQPAQPYPRQARALLRVKLHGQDWPYTGLSLIMKNTLAGGGNAGLLSQTINTYLCTDFISASGELI